MEQGWPWPAAKRAINQAGLRGSWHDSSSVLLSLFKVAPKLVSNKCVCLSFDEIKTIKWREDWKWKLRIENGHNCVS